MNQVSSIKRKSKPAQKGYTFSHREKAEPALKLSNKGFTFLYNKKANQLVKFQTNGFTLIEVLVTVAVTGLLTVMATVIFINTIRNSKKAEISSEARQIAALVIDRIQKDARDADSLNHDSDTLTIDGPTGIVVWQCYPDPDPGGPGSVNGYITRDTASGPELTVTNRDRIDGISFDDCVFESSSPAGTNLVIFKFAIHEGAQFSAGSSSEYQVSLPYVTSISKRNFNN
jgi:prepilin-type N-terminal cleavage/methylation domain-containing protein